MERKSVLRFPRHWPRVTVTDEQRREAEGATVPCPHCHAAPSHCGCRKTMAHSTQPAKETKKGFILFEMQQREIKKD